MTGTQSWPAARIFVGDIQVRVSNGSRLNFSFIITIPLGASATAILESCPTQATLVPSWLNPTLWIQPPPVGELENSAIRFANGIFAPHSVGAGLGSISLMYVENTRTLKSVEPAAEIFIFVTGELIWKMSQQKLNSTEKIFTRGGFSKYNIPPLSLPRRILFGCQSTVVMVERRGFRICFATHQSFSWSK